MTRVLLPVLTALASVTCLNSSAADPKPTVSLLLLQASAERWGQDIHFRCEVRLDNDTGRDLAVRSNFFSVFDGLELVVTTRAGKVLEQRPYTFHQSPFTFRGQDFTLKQGSTKGTLVFPIRDLPREVKTVKVRLVGTLPGSSYERILSPETLEVEVKERPGK